MRRLVVLLGLAVTVTAPPPATAAEITLCGVLSGHRFGADVPSTPCALARSATRDYIRRSEAAAGVPRRIVGRHPGTGLRYRLTRVGTTQSSMRLSSLYLGRAGDAVLRVRIVQRRRPPSDPLIADLFTVFDGQVDAIMTLGAKAFMFRGGEVLRYDLEADAVDRPAQPVGQVFVDLPFAAVDAATVFPNREFAVITSGGEAVLYDLLEDRVAGPARPLADVFYDVPFARIDAAVTIGGFVHLLSGGQSARYDVAAGRVTAVTPVADAFPGSFPGTVDAAERLGSATFFFQDDRYRVLSD